MDKFEMKLTWHNCKHHPPKEEYNPWLIYTNGQSIDSLEYYKKYGFPIDENILHNFWWADLSRTVREFPVFKELF